MFSPQHSKNIIFDIISLVSHQSEATLRNRMSGSPWICSKSTKQDKDVSTKASQNAKLSTKAQHCRAVRLTMREGPAGLRASLHVDQKSCSLDLEHRLVKTACTTAKLKEGLMLTSPVRACKTLLWMKALRNRPWARADWAESLQRTSSKNVQRLCSLEIRILLFKDPEKVRDKDRRWTLRSEVRVFGLRHPINCKCMC